MKHDIKDLAGGVLLAAIGLFVALYTAAQYDIGSLRRMGPGFFPALLGGVLAVLGLIIALPAWKRTGPPVQIAWKDTAAVLAAILVFATGLERVGLVPITVATVLIAPTTAPSGAWPSAPAFVTLAWSNWTTSRPAAPSFEGTSGGCCGSR